jgi:hypothetical protein
MKYLNIILFLYLGTFTHVQAQNKTGSIIGSIYNDMSGDEVEGVKVSLELGGANVKMSLSDEAGSFRIYNIPPGHYDVILSAMGFPPLKLNDVPVNSLENTALELYFHGESFAQDTVFMSFKEYIANNNSSKQEHDKIKKTREQKRLERAARKLED